MTEEQRDHLARFTKMFSLAIGDEFVFAMVIVERATGEMRINSDCGNTGSCPKCLLSQGSERLVAHVGENAVPAGATIQ